MHRHRAALLVVWTLCAAARGAAQTPAESPPSRPLPVSGTLIYNLLFTSHPEYYERVGVGARFAGRIALPAGPRTWAGFGVGSWAQAKAGECFAWEGCAFAEYWSEAVVYQVYVQHAPFRRVPLWGRVGIGTANTWTALPVGPVTLVQEKWRPALTWGAGLDVRIADHVFLTPSIDFTALTGAGSARLGAYELRHALALGLGTTIR